jgi:hypothetical protein
VEIGGWHAKFWGQNPPAEFLEEETAAQLPWHLWLAEQSPRVVVEEPRAVALGDGRWRVEATVRNVGFLPTSLTGRGAVGRPASGREASRPGVVLDGSAEDGGPLMDQVVRPVHAVLEGEGVTLEEGVRRVRVGHLRGTGPHLAGVGPAARTVSWVVRVPDGGAPVVRVIALSDKGGVARSPSVRLGGAAGSGIAR